ncbi:hypothetical protein [Halosolutus halophilus]|uniref:hypothetical protein n=1 Tax=Halosolutus halophilus TaxID=1552990 RepID=UPI002235190B|nr:hypothetical protein [Halosolutus halophilus]
MSNPTADSTIDPDDESPADRPQPEPDDGVDLQSSTVRRYLAWGALGVCSVLALFALVQFYGSVADAIDLWIEPRHQPLMRAAFNLVVLLASLTGVSLIVRELS